ncbi:DHH family phosphoesterase [Candidatus Bathyarchaeota archaeon]|nr:DHH family phosphoesterase [Candidatus Bathyarchaeota archaeon]
MEVQILGSWIFTHGDVDGLCAGAIALAAYPDANVFFTHPYGLEGDLHEAKDADRIIICDIALSESHLNGLLKAFSKIAETSELIYIDHHPLPEGLSEDEIAGVVVHSLDSSASELTYRFFQSRIDSLHARTAIMGAIGDYLDDTPLIKRLLERWDKRTLYFESGLLIQGIEGQKRNYDLKRSIVYNLANKIPPSFDRMLVELAIQNTHLEEIAIRELRDRAKLYGNVAYILNFPFSHGKTATYIRGLTGAMVGLAGEERRGMIDMSLRASSQKIDLNRILRRITPHLGGSGGGHPMAAGARVPKEKFMEFLRELNECLRGSVSLEAGGLQAPK